MGFAGIVDNPFDASAPSYAPETRTLEQVLLQAVRAAALNLRVALPAKIHAIKGDQTVDVQPMLQSRFVGKGVQDMALLQDVPVAMPMGADWRIGLPLAPGDLGLCVFCDRNIDAFLGSDGTAPQDPQDRRAHDLSDAVFYPGLVPAKRQSTDVQATGDMVLQNGHTTLRLRKGGTVAVQNAQLELVAVLDRLVAANLQLAQDLQAAQTLTAFGPAPFIAASVQQFVGVAQSLQAIRQDLDTFKT